VVTNQHVIEGAQRIKVRLNNAKTLDAAFLEGSPGHDLSQSELPDQGRDHPSFTLVAADPNYRCGLPLPYQTSLLAPYQFGDYYLKVIDNP
jgi:hypothetical protein